MKNRVTPIIGMLVWFIVVGMIVGLVNGCSPVPTSYNRCIEQYHRNVEIYPYIDHESMHGQVYMRCLNGLNTRPGAYYNDFTEVL